MIYPEKHIYGSCPYNIYFNSNLDIKGKHYFKIGRNTAMGYTPIFSDEIFQSY